jgi:putative endonuclease
LKYITYIIFSKSLNRYYTGHTDDIKKRLSEHNRGKSRYTKTGIPWGLKKSFIFETRKEACSLEMKIKRRGCQRFLNEISSLK